MADYKTLKGFKVKSLASDPTVNKGQLWYNTTSNTLKYDTVAAGTWASGTAVPTATNGNLGFGSTTATIMAGGQDAPGTTTYVDTSFTWNGTSWAEDATINQARFEGAGFGASSTSGIIVGGFHSPPGTNADNAEEFDGTSWTALATLNTGRRALAAAGIVGAGLAMGGEGPAMSALTEEWNGTSWTEVEDLLTARNALASAYQGTTTAAMVFGGLNPGAAWGTVQVVTEQYNGTCWTEVNDLTTGRGFGGGAGNQAGALYFGGTGPAYPGVIALGEQWDGTSWAEAADLATARRSLGNYSGSSAAALAIAGMAAPGSASQTAVVEIWDGVPAGVKTVTTS